MFGYFLMNNEQVGFDPTIQQSDGKRYVEIIWNGKIERLILVEDIKNKRQLLAERRQVGGLIAMEMNRRNLSSLRTHGNMKNDLKKRDSSRRQRTKACETSPGTIITRGSRLAARTMIPSRMYVRSGSMKTYGRTTFRQRSFNELEATVLESQGKALWQAAIFTKAIVRFSPDGAAS